MLADSESHHSLHRDSRYGASLTMLQGESGSCHSGESCECFVFCLFTLRKNCVPRHERSRDREETIAERGWRSEHNLQESVFSFLHPGPRGPTRVFRLGKSRCLPLSHLASPSPCFFIFIYPIHIQFTINLF